MRNDLQAAVEKLELLSAEHELMANNPDEHPFGKTMLRSRKAAIDTALAALRDMMRRQEGCVNCENRFWYFTEYRFNPNYCPSCGKHLEPVGNADMLPTVSKTESVEEEEE